MEILVTLFLPLSLSVIMLSLGLSLTLKDFVDVAKRPGAFVIGLSLQLVLMPLIAFGIASLFSLSPELSAGLILLAACPSGVTGNLISKMAKGDVALSVSLNATSSIVSAITLPIVMSVAMGYFVQQADLEIDTTRIAVTMFLLTVSPIFIGMLFARLAPSTASKIEPGFAKLAMALFVIIVVAALATNWTLFIENLALLGPSIATMSALVCLLCFVIPFVLKTGIYRAKSISIVTTVQNPAVGITVATIFSGQTEGFSVYALPAAVYGIVTYMVVIPVALWFKRLS